MSKTKLRECAFCGSDFVGSMQTEGLYQITCHACNAEGPTRGTERKAINAWNKRPREKELEDMIDRWEARAVDMPPPLGIVVANYDGYTKE